MIEIGPGVEAVVGARVGPRQVAAVAAEVTCAARWSSGECIAGGVRPSYVRAECRLETFFVFFSMFFLVGKKKKKVFKFYRILFFS